MLVCYPFGVLYSIKVLTGCDTSTGNLILMQHHPCWHSNAGENAFKIFALKYSHSFVHKMLAVAFSLSLNLKYYISILNSFLLYTASERYIQDNYS